MNKKISVFLGFFLGCFLYFCSFFCVPVLAQSNNDCDRILVKYKNSSNIEIINFSNNKNRNDLIEEYRKNSSVEYVEPDYSYYASVVPSDVFYSKQWYLEKIRAPYAWDKIRDASNMVIAVIDSGVQIKHPDLYPNIWVNEDEIPDNGIDDDKNGFIDDYNGWDFLSNTPDPTPKFEEGYTEAGITHGTIVSGIIAAVGNNSSGVSGISWKAQIMPLRVLNDSGEGRTSEVIRAIDYAIANGADVINFSFVGFDYSQGLYEAVERAHKAGIVMVAAAGNEQSGGEGYNLDETPMYPACDDGDDNMVIGVAATDSMDQKAHFSSYGIRCVDVAAPGVSFYSTVTYAPDKKIGSRFFDQYFNGFWSGTSMATPVVAGSLALVQAINPSSSGKESQEIILATADNIDRLNPAYAGKLGSGRINVFNAVLLSERMMKEKTRKIILSAASLVTPEIEEVNIDGSAINSFRVYGDEVESGVNITAGSFGDYGQDSVVVGAGSGRVPEVMIFSADGSLRMKFLAYANNFRGGVNVAVGDVDGDGVEEIITGAGFSGGPHVRIFDSAGNVKSQFFAYDKNFRGGVNVAVGDVDGDGVEEIVTGAGPGGGPHIRVFDINGKVKAQFFAYDKNFRGGVFVSVADIDGNTARRGAEIITSPGKGGEPQVKVFDIFGRVKTQFFAYANNFRGGISAAAGDLNGDGLAEIVTGAGPGGGPHVRIFDSKGKILNSFYAFDQNFVGGVNVGTILIK